MIGSRHLVRHRARILEEHGQSVGGGGGVLLQASQVTEHVKHLHTDGKSEEMTKLVSTRWRVRTIISGRKNCANDRPDEATDGERSFI